MVRKIAGIIFALAGIGLFIAGSMVAGEVGDGRSRIRKGQKTLNVLNKLSSFDSRTKKLSKYATKPAQGMIDDGHKTADHYESVSNWLYVGGCVVFVVGVGIFALGFMNRKES